FLASAFTVIRPIPIPTVFPYTTLFRSRIGFVAVEVARTVSTHSGVATYQKSAHFDFASARQGVYRGTYDQWAIVKGEENMFRVRSEEHTSELQSRENLVCRLLLEKKKC